MKIIKFIFIILSLFSYETIGSYRGEHISMKFYLAGESVDKAKNNVHRVLDSFLETFHRNLNETSVKLDKYPDYLNSAANVTRKLSQLTENFFEIAKNESLALLKKLRHVPTTRDLKKSIKNDLNDYYTEMDNFQIIFATVIDDAMEFMLEALRNAEMTYTAFSSKQDEILSKRKLKTDDWCRQTYKEFLLKWTDQIFHCATTQMSIVYDMLSITKINTYHVLKMIEHRILKVYNCFQFGHYQFRCRFLKNADHDFDMLLSKMEELQMFNDRQKRRVYLERRWNRDLNCIPLNFPDAQMTDNLKSCFYFSQYGEDKTDQRK